ncbi:MAG TPA: YicC/YloC family endoribonuclease [Burkholderiales bacterium]|nr:YicC/YloC family endoribonuclease [Burkholderiales bacterium]
MIQSMTGYAAVTRELPQGALTLDLRSVNSRFLDVQFRISEDLRAVEPLLRELIGAALTRGKIDCRLGFSAATLAQKDARLNTAVVTRLGQLAAGVREALPEALPLRVVDVLNWPGVLADDADSTEALREAVTAAANEALSELKAARAREGAKLAEMIRERVARIRGRLGELEPLIPQAIAAYEEKLATKLREVLSGGEEERIRQEIAVFGVRIDVAEELSRLSTHLDEVDRVLKTGGAVGKRLDFLMQELNRETNTLGSKSVSKELSAAVLDFKLLIEQMREQVQNLE